MSSTSTPIPTATVLRRVRGKFARFEGGEKVMVRHTDGDSCLIERTTWEGSKVPICNQLAGVPLGFLKFDQ